MAVTIILLGPLAGYAETSELYAPAPLDWAGLLALVGPQLASILQEKKVNVACAGKVLQDKRSLMASDGDEVALLPPVSGG